MGGKKPVVFSKRVLNNLFLSSFSIHLKKHYCTYLLYMYFGNDGMFRDWRYRTETEYGMTMTD